MPEIFVFGSNLLGIHKKGAALTAFRQHGAILGQGMGLQGNSYAIPTKDTPYSRLDLIAINKFVADFLLFAAYTPKNTYKVTKIGCGLAAFQPSDIAPMFGLVCRLNNVKLPREFIEFIPGLEFLHDFIAIFDDFE